MFETLSRRYKGRTPVETVDYIKQILYRMDLIPEENFSANPYPGIYSSSISLSPYRGAFRTNGKGRSPEYSLASAYAEHIERIQNLLFASFSRTNSKKLHEEFGFIYYPDEKYMTKAELKKLPEKILQDFFRHSKKNRLAYIDAYFNRLAANGLKGATSIPFYDTNNKKIQYLPLNLLLLSVGSNGMAAGNTIPEAVFQAICELMERWAAALIFYGQLTPPTIPRKYLDSFSQETEIIDYIQSNDRYKVVIKDFSAGRNLPVVGVMIVDEQAGKYRLNVGSDTSFQVALSRSLTEIFQGIQNEKQFDEGMLQIPDKIPEYFAREDDEAKNIRYHVFSDFTKDNSGVFPPSLFGKNPDYEFDQSTFSQQGSYEDESRRLIKYFHDQGIPVYIRDVSVLGFPTVFVYIPEVSGEGRKSAPSAEREGRYLQVDLDHIEDYFFNLDKCTPEQLSEVAQRLEFCGKEFPAIKFFNVDLVEDSPWKQISFAFVLVQIYYTLGEYEKALESFRCFLEQRKEKKTYYLLVEQFLFAKTKKLNDQEIVKSLIEYSRKEELDESMVKTVMSDMSEPYDMKKFIPLPKCPDCINCALNKHCETRHKLSLARIVYSNMSSISQDMAWLDTECCV